MPPDNNVDKIRRQPLDAKGICGKCSSKADTECMQCFGCNDYFHVINCPPGTKQNQVTKTFFDGWDNIVRHYKNIQYVCEACLHDRKLKNEIIISNRMCVMEEEISAVKNTIDKEFKELRDIITKVKSPPNDGNFPDLESPKEPTWSDIASKPTNSAIVIKKKKNGPPADINKVHHAAVSTNTPVSKAYHNNAGDTVVVLENEASKNVMVPILEEQMDSDRFSVVAVKQRLPTISIVNIDREYTKEQLLERVQQQNTSRIGNIELDDDNFKIIYMRKQFKNPNLMKAVVRVSNELRYLIEKSGDHLNIGLSSCAVYDDFFIRRCNRCQSFNHWKDNCPADIPVVCGRCGENHDTKTCKSDVIKCCNCIRAGHSETDHETSSVSCLSYKEAQKKLYDTINYYKERPKNINSPSR